MTEFDLMKELAERVEIFRGSYADGKLGQLTAARVLDWLVAWNVSTADAPDRPRARAVVPSSTGGSANAVAKQLERTSIGAASMTPWEPPGDPRKAQKNIERELAGTPKKAVHCDKAAINGGLTRVEPPGSGHQPHTAEPRETIKVQVTRGVTKALREAGMPLTGRQLLLALLEDGITINGVNPSNNLAAHITATSAFRLWPEGWWFRDEPRPARAAE